MDRRRLAVMVVLVGAIAAFVTLDLQRFLSLRALQQQQASVEAFRAQHAVEAVALFVTTYVAVAALSLPGAAIMTLAGGATFGLAFGTLLVSFASSVGATIAFLVSRFVLHDLVQRRFADRLAALNDGVRQEGAFYLFALRLVPAVPFWLVNLAMGLTPIRAGTFYWVSQLGMLPGTIVYVYAGTQLGEFRLSAGLVAAFVVLGLFPLAAKRAVAAWRSRCRTAG